MDPINTDKIVIAQLQKGLLIANQNRFRAQETVHENSVKIYMMSATIHIQFIQLSIKILTLLDVWDRIWMPLQMEHCRILMHEIYGAIAMYTIEILNVYLN